MFYGTEGVNDSVKYVESIATHRSMGKFVRIYMGFNFQTHKKIVIWDIYILSEYNLIS